LLGQEGQFQARLDRRVRVGGGRRRGGGGRLGGRGGDARLGGAAAGGGAEGEHRGEDGEAHRSHEVPFSADVPVLTGLSREMSRGVSTETMSRRPVTMDWISVETSLSMSRLRSSPMSSTPA